MFDDRTIAEYLRRSYFSVDGLWFVKVEERLDFAEALRLDVEVWRILAKIQARKARELLGLGAPSAKGGSRSGDVQDSASAGRPLADLVAALRLKFAAEQYAHQVASETPQRVESEITACPWLKLLRRAGREHLAARMAEAMCPTEYAAWAREFDPAIVASVAERMCSGGCSCRLVLEAPG